MTDVQTAAPLSIPDMERLKLFVRAGGRCEICNDYLLEDEFTAQVFNFGEMAHNVGRKKSAKSPRGLDPLPVEDRNKAENLLLLCEKHHKLIDHQIKRNEYPVEGLRKLKKAHEDRIKYQTGMAEDQRTAIIRMVGNVHNAAVELSEENVRKIVLKDDQRYPDFPLTVRGQDFEIDLRDLPAEGSPEYWNVGREKIRIALENRLQESVLRGDVRHLSVFAISRIPFLVYLGYMLDDKIPTDTYQKQRNAAQDWHWDTAGAAVEFGHELLQKGTDPTKVALLLNLSGTIQLAELPTQVDATFYVFAIKPVSVVPNRSLVTTRETLANFSKEYHLWLSELEVGFKGTRAVHLFPAIGLTPALECGRGLMRDVHPKLLVYDRSADNNFNLALEIN